MGGCICNAQVEEVEDPESAMKVCSNGNFGPCRVSWPFLLRATMAMAVFIDVAVVVLLQPISISAQKAFPGNDCSIIYNNHTGTYIASFSGCNTDQYYIY